jgi:hypothetical protein
VLGLEAAVPWPTFRVGVCRLEIQQHVISPSTVLSCRSLDDLSRGQYQKNCDQSPDARRDEVLKQAATDAASALLSPK